MLFFGTRIDRKFWRFCEKCWPYYKKPEITPGVSCTDFPFFDRIVHEKPVIVGVFWKLKLKRSKFRPSSPSPRLQTKPYYIFFKLHGQPKCKMRFYDFHAFVCIEPSEISFFQRYVIKLFLQKGSMHQMLFSTCQGFQKIRERRIRWLMTSCMYVQHFSPILISMVLFSIFISPSVTAVYIGANIIQPHVILSFSRLRLKSIIIIYFQCI